MGVLDRRQAEGHIAMLGFSAMVAGSFTFGALTGPYIAPIALNAARFWLAGALLLVAALASTGLTAKDFAKPWRYLVLGGLYAIYFVTMFEGLITATPVSIAAVFTLTPILAAFFGWLFLRQILTPRMALALAIGGLGALWVIFEADWDKLRAFQVGRGEIIYFIGVVAHAIYTPLVRKTNRGEPALVFTFGVVVFAAVILTVLGWPAIAATDWTAMPPVVWWAIAYTGVFATAGTIMLMQIASLRLPAAKVMAHTYLVPGWVIVWELAFGRSPPTALVLVGLGLSVVALVLLLRDDEAKAG